VSVHQGIGPGKQDGMSGAANHSEVHASAGHCASPMAGTHEPDLHQQSSRFRSSGLAATESQPKDCKNEETLRTGHVAQVFAQCLAAILIPVTVGVIY